MYVSILGKNQWEGLEIYGKYNNLISINKNTYTSAPESCFTFDSATKKIKKYDLDNPSCPYNPEIPDTIGGVEVEHIGPGAFITPDEQWCDDEEEPVDINYDNTETGTYEYCYYLVPDDPGPITAVKLPRYLKTIGYGAFYTNQIKNLTMQNNLITIGDDAFSTNELKSVFLPSSVITIGRDSFSYNNIEQFIISNSVTTIGIRAIYGNKLTNIALPSSVTSLAIGFLGGNRNLASLTVDRGNPNYKSINNAIYTKDGTTLVVGTKVMANNIDRNANFIGPFSFLYMSLTSVTIEENINTIGNNAFSGNQLSTLVIPASVTSIGNGAFNLNKLTTITMGGDDTILGDGLLYYLNNYFREKYYENKVGTYTGTQTGTWTKQP